MNGFMTFLIWEIFITLLAVLFYFLERIKNKMLKLEKFESIDKIGLFVFWTVMSFLVIKSFILHN